MRHFVFLARSRILINILHTTLSTGRLAVISRLHTLNIATCDIFLHVVSYHLVLEEIVVDHGLHLIVLAIIGIIHSLILQCAIVLRHHEGIGIVIATILVWTIVGTFAHVRDIERDRPVVWGIVGIVVMILVCIHRLEVGDWCTCIYQLAASFQSAELQWQLTVCVTLMVFER